MNLHKKRLVRTANSEQYALFDLDQTDVNLDPVSIGKLELHFTQDGTYGSLLLWKEVIAPLDDRRREILIDTVLNELSTTMGINPEYALEVFSPALADYELYSNMGDSEPDDEDEDYAASDV
jgi:hypothetical protein